MGLIKCSIDRFHEGLWEVVLDLVLNDVQDDIFKELDEEIEDIGNDAPIDLHLDLVLVEVEAHGVDGDGGDHLAVVVLGRHGHGEHKVSAPLFDLCLEITMDGHKEEVILEVAFDLSPKVARRQHDGVVVLLHLDGDVVRVHWVQMHVQVSHLEPILVNVWEVDHVNPVNDVGQEDGFHLCDHPFVQARSHPCGDSPHGRRQEK
mmetsp:Transcript_2152/g.2048  ORF Transcript_2152/g.2048 Transcript_2152/m.2048 type:complete len:204 (+) Transcript_2152:221-832(+)